MPMALIFGCVYYIKDDDDNNEAQTMQAIQIYVDNNVVQ